MNNFSINILYTLKIGHYDKILTFKRRFMVSLSSILSFPSKFLTTTSDAKIHYALPIFLTNEWFKYFEHAPSKGFENLAEEAKTVMGFISGIEFLRDLGSNFGKPTSVLSSPASTAATAASTAATAASLSKKLIKFMGFLHTKEIYKFSSMDSYNKAEPFFGAVSCSIKCYEECVKLATRGMPNKNLVKAAAIQSGAFAIFDGLSFFNKMGWTRDFKIAKLCASTVGVTATFFQLGYKHYYNIK
jgi:hypothetical protein